MNDLREVIHLLKSEKIKERQEGLAAIRTTFARDSAVHRLDPPKDPKDGDEQKKKHISPWLVVFQALFTAVLSEKAAVTKPARSTKSKSASGSSTAAARRLGESAATVRWLIERVVRRLNSKLVKPLLAHLIQTLVHNGELLAPVALDYIKALRCIVGYSGHLDHLEDSRWVDMVERAFNVVLGDPIRASLQDSDEMDEEGGRDGTDFSSDEGMLDEDEDEPTTSTARKRRHREPSETPRSTPRPTATNTAVSLEQIEMMSLLVTLLSSPAAPFLSPAYSYLPHAILKRFSRFLDTHPSATSSSLYPPFLQALSATLNHLALNKRSEVEAFAHESWNGLVALWGTKNRGMKADLVGVLRILFPYFTSTPIPSTPSVSSDFAWADGVAKLWQRLDGEAQNRWGIDGLDLDKLRLTCRSTKDEGAFALGTFRAGFGFDEGQALAWAILELQAACAEKLFLFSESMYSTSSAGAHPKKRTKLENPITSLLTSITSSALSSAIRAYHLQILLFFVSHHWHILHPSLQKDVIAALMQLVTFDDGSVQSWVFMCFAAIANVDSNVDPLSGKQSIIHNAATWDPVWTHAIRRTNVPSVSRAACHTAWILLLIAHSPNTNSTHAKSLLTSSHLLVEIETLAKDLDVQGPPVPSDSVCAFLTACLRFAAQDVRLYRMQLEEKVLSWLMDTWGRFDQNSRTRMPLYTISDILGLLESICTLGKRSNLVVRMPMPQCSIVDIVVDEQRTRVIRDFLLDAKLPPFRPPGKHHVGDSTVLSVHAQASSSPASIVATSDLAPPRGRERKISAFILKSLEALIADWETTKEPASAASFSSAEYARRSLDTAVIGLLFESLLVLNGTSANRRVVQAACKLMVLITPLLTGARWTAEERALVLLGLDPLVAAHDREGGQDSDWQAMLPPDEGTGIKTETLRNLLGGGDARSSPTSVRRELQKVVCQSADVQDAFSTIRDSLRLVLRSIAGRKTDDPQAPEAMNVDDTDGFGPIRTAHNVAQSSDTVQQVDSERANRYVAEVCIAFLSVVPILQSASGEATRDKQLTELVQNAEAETFILVAPTYFTQVRERTLNLNATGLSFFLEKFAVLLREHQYSHSERLRLLVVQFLDATLLLWLQPLVSNTEVGREVWDLCSWLSKTLRNKHIRSWKSRDATARFLDRYLENDPTQSLWSTQWPKDEALPVEFLPVALLHFMGADEDIRVRVRAALANARLFVLARRIGQDAMILYADIKEHLSLELDHYEHMLTRLLSLGNVMIVSSAVRRGPYWHLLETCLASDGVLVTGAKYSVHIEAVLRGVAERMGLTRFSDLFDAYASQIAYSIRQATTLDFLRFPPRLLGYRDRKECAEAMFDAFTPTNVLAGGDRNAVAHGQSLFASHCKAVQITPSQGILRCFGDIVGYQVVFWMDKQVDETDPLYSELDELLKAKTTGSNDPAAFDSCLEGNTDTIATAILRTLGDQDILPNGAIVSALREASDEASSTAFLAVTRFRHLEKFQTHAPNLPSFSAVTVLGSLQWLRQRVSGANISATIYHVLHQLIAHIHRSPLVNEQIRLLNSVAVWVAFHRKQFEDLTLLHTLIHGATSLLGQADIARAAQSILDWAFSICRHKALKDPRLPDALIRVACIARTHASNNQDQHIAGMGSDLLHWIDDQASKFYAAGSTRSQLALALSAWPHTPSSDLLGIYEAMPAEKFSSVLSDHRIASNKFRVVRRLQELAARHTDNGDQFAKTDFWRLKECIPASDQLQDDDVDAFAALLVAHKGHIDSFGSEPPLTQSLRYRHSRSSRDKDPDGSPRRAIVTTLLSTLDGNNASRVYVAYNTLRLLLSVVSSDIPNLHSWPSDYRREIQYLEAYPRPLIARSQTKQDLATVLESKSLDLTGDFPRWISMVTTLLSDVLSAADPFYAQLDTILHSDVSFAEQMLPVLVHTVLQAELQSKTTDALSHRALLSGYFTSVLTSGCASVACQQSIVDTILHLRNFAPTNTQDFLAYDKWLDVNFSLLAKSAIACGAYTTALLFLELDAEYSSDVPSGDVVAEQILFDIYSHIDEPDGFYGIKTKDLRQFLIKRFHHERQWEKAFRFHGAALEAGNNNSSEAEGLLHSFHSFGFDHLAIDTLQNSSTGLGSNFNSSGMSYRLGWRTETWDLPELPDEGTPGASLYLALRAIYRERDARTVDKIVRHALREEICRLRDLGAENLTEIRETAQSLMSLSQVIQWRSNNVQHCLQSRRIELDDWANFVDLDSDFDFLDLENIMATRVSLIRSIRQKEERGQIGTMLAPFSRGLIEIEKRCLIRLSEAARDSDQFQVALNSIVRAQKLEGNKPSFEVSQEFASVLWFQKEQKLAVQFLKELVDPTEGKASSPGGAKTQRALLLARLGTWTAEACLEKPTDIMAHFFDPAVTLLDEVEPKDPAHAAVYHECAIFAEHQYQAISRSPDVIRWKVYADRKTEELIQRSQQMSRLAPNSPELHALQHHQTKAQALLNQDKKFFQQHHTAQSTFLEQALDMYSRCLAASDAFDADGAIRLCSLWFANFDDGPLQCKVRTALDRIPTRKVVFLAHQLSARLSSGSASKVAENQENLQALVVRMCQDHPFHSLYQVYCLRPDQPSAESNRPPRRQSARHESPSSQTARAIAAGNVFDRLRDGGVHGQRVNDVEKICNASLEWAQYPIKKDKLYDKEQHKAPFKVPDHLLIRKVKAKIPVVTAHTPIDPTLRYDDCAWIDHFDVTFDTAGGVNLPKISVCYSVDGGKYKQLYKGEGGDDLRQDAVMEQVFDLVNVVLRRDRQTRRRNLGIRDYKVVPLAAQAGVLEFVGNTMPLQKWLGNAHPRYRPNDIKVKTAQNQMAATRKQTKGNADALLALFLDIRSKFRPVMRHYFTEKHKTPISWFAMRLNYTRSVATTSIVGHILGLGDRHISNILMDNVTGEVVHIDLGIAFDQGKLLPIPERIPFRLTADIVDGMGTSGTQGVFQRCAEETLRVLRDGSEVILTVLEVFKYDPLHSWTASELKVKRAQGTNDANNTHTTAAATSRFGIGIDMSSGTADEAADRALTSVTRKLDKSLSVEYTVNELIAEATDPLNLATVFVGWGPFY